MVRVSKPHAHQGIRGQKPPVSQILPEPSRFAHCEVPRKLAAESVAGGGETCSQIGDGYSETVAHAIGQNQQPLVGTTTRFTWTPEHGKWHHKGTLRVGQATQETEEILERAPNTQEEQGNKPRKHAVSPK